MHRAADGPAPAPDPHDRRRWQLHLLGRVLLLAPSGAALRLPGPAATLLLARLALPPQRRHAREELIELLWPGVAPATARNRLRQLLSVLRTLLPPDLLDADRLTLGLADGALACDVALFEAAVRAHQPDAAALYAGELLPGFYDDWVLDERRRLAALAERPEVAAPAPRAGLPRYLTRLLGAEAMAAQLRAAVCQHRLVTLVGPGGGGKTRLAVEVAQALQDAGDPFQRIDFVPLAACTGAPAMADALLVALGLPGGAAEPLNTLVQALTGRRVLLVLDNCEQLVDSAAPFIAALAARLPLAHWLVTSRRVLGLDGEQELALPTLPLPPPRAGIEALARNPAVALLLDRARAVAPGLRLHPGNAPALVALVRALEGLPLAIELVATRLRSLAPELLLGLLQAHGEPALALLARSGPRSGHDERHASMLKVVRWSWSLLNPPAQALLAAVAVFEGGFSLAAASAVCDTLSAGDAALGLDELVQHALLRAEPETGRYALYEVVREAALLALTPAQRTQLRTRQRQWMVRWAQALPASPSLPAVRRELRNIAAALVSAEADGAPDDALALWEALQRALSDISLPPAARAALAQCLQALPASPARAAARATLARAAMRAGDGGAAQALASAALAELPAQGLPRAVVLARVAHIRWRLQRDTGVAAWLDEAASLAQAEGALALQASVWSVQGAMRRPQDPAAAATLQQQAIAAWQAAGDTHGVNTGRYNLALALTAQPALRAQALQEITQVQADTRAVEDWGQLASANNQRGEILSWLHRWDEAVAAYREGIAVADDALELLPLAYCLWNLPGALAHRREPDSAGRLMGFAARFWAERFGALSAADRHDQRRVQRLVAAQLGPVRARQLMDEGQALSLAEAVRLALG
jgi:predicted ATPase